jgi:hypothetical protein
MTEPSSGTSSIFALIRAQVAASSWSIEYSSNSESSYST